MKEFAYTYDTVLSNSSVTQSSLPQRPCTIARRATSNYTHTAASSSGPRTAGGCAFRKELTPWTTHIWRCTETGRGVQSGKWTEYELWGPGGNWREWRHSSWGRDKDRTLADTSVTDDWEADSSLASDRLESWLLTGDVFSPPLKKSCRAGSGNIRGLAGFAGHCCWEVVEGDEDRRLRYHLSSVAVHCIWRTQKQMDKGLWQCREAMLA